MNPQHSQLVYVYIILVSKQHYNYFTKQLSKLKLAYIFLKKKSCSE